MGSLRVLTNLPPPKRTDQIRADLGFCRDLLGELRVVAARTGADVLVYLIEMAYVESEDVLTGKTPLGQGNPHGSSDTKPPR